MRAQRSDLAQIKRKFNRVFPEKRLDDRADNVPEEDELDISENRE